MDRAVSKIKGFVCPPVLLALGEGYQQVVGGGAMRLVTYPQVPGTLTRVGAGPGGSVPHSLAGQGFLGTHPARVVPYPQPQVQMASGSSKYGFDTDS